MKVFDVFYERGGKEKAPRLIDELQREEKRKKRGGQ